MPYFINQYTGLDEATTPAANFVISAQDQSLTTSILSAGTFFGAIIAGDVADYIGRRTTIMLGCLVFCIGCIFEVASTSLPVMVSDALALQSFIIQAFKCSLKSGFLVQDTLHNHITNR
jgi:MFS family permease